MNIYVGNLSHDVTEDDLQSAFQAFGRVESVNVITDRYSGESRGFGFVEMPSKNEGIAAIEGLNGTKLKSKSIAVNEARPKGNSRGGNRGGRGGGYGGRRRY